MNNLKKGSLKGTLQNKALFFSVEISWWDSMHLQTVGFLIFSFLYKEQTRFMPRLKQDSNQEDFLKLNHDWSLECNFA